MLTYNSVKFLNLKPLGCFHEEVMVGVVCLDKSILHLKKKEKNWKKNYRVEIFKKTDNKEQGGARLY